MTWILVFSQEIRKSLLVDFFFAFHLLVQFNRKFLENIQVCRKKLHDSKHFECSMKINSAFRVDSPYLQQQVSFFLLVSENNSRNNDNKNGKLFYLSMALSFHFAPNCQNRCAVCSLHLINVSVSVQHNIANKKHEIYGGQ